MATFGVLGFGAGARPLADNSLFVHLRTGIDLARTGVVPRHDPYSFTARGARWVVQSWLASAVYGLTYRAGSAALGSLHAANVVVLLQAALMAGLAVLVALLARTGSGPRTIVSAGLAVTLGATFWSPRPLIFGLLGLALLATVVERRANPLWLLPIMWIWVNTHGSFPLALAWLGLRCAGELFDSRRFPCERLPVIGATIGGLVLGAVNPLGPRLLWFPLSVGSKAAAFRHIVEWASPNFQTTQGSVALLLVGLSVVLLARHRVPWSDALPAGAFLAFGLYSSRNLAPLAVVLAPVLGRALQAPTRRSNPGRRRPIDLAAGVVLALLVLAFAVHAMEGTGLGLANYPTQAEAWMEGQRLVGSGRSVMAQDYVGCYLILLHGQQAGVFIDDRVDMYPLQVSNDYIALLHGDPDAADIVSRYAPAAVLWHKGLPLVAELERSGRWRRSYDDPSWVVLTPA